MTMRVREWPFACWLTYSHGEGIDLNGWERKWRARLTCPDCGRRFWRVFRYVCRRCM